eukprot:jgi/Tetstr1/444968/TSEL_032785.t1
MFPPDDEVQDWAYGPGGPEADHLFEKWLREQMRRRVEMEMRWEQEAAERDVQEYRWMRHAGGGLVSSFVNCLFFVPLQYRRIVCRLESMLWQCMLLVCPDVIWAILFSCAFGMLVFHGPVMSWSSPTHWTLAQGVVDAVLVYLVISRVLFRTFNDWKFRRRLKWWAGQGYIDAQYSLGSMYEAGDGIPTDLRLAAHWYHKAAQNGHCDAQYSLGECYFKGHGVPVNLREARKWYQRAANQGDADAEGMEDHIKKLLESNAQSSSSTGASSKHAAGRGGSASVPRLPAPSMCTGGDPDQAQLRRRRQKEYEQMESQRKQQAIEKRKAKAERQRREKQLKEEAEAEAARQAAEIKRLVEEEARQRARSQGPAAKGGKPSGGGGRAYASAASSTSAPAATARAEPERKATRTRSDVSNSSGWSEESSHSSAKQGKPGKQQASTPHSKPAPEAKRPAPGTPTASRASSSSTLAGGARRAEQTAPSVTRSPPEGGSRPGAGPSASPKSPRPTYRSAFAPHQAPPPPGGPRSPHPRAVPPPPPPSTPPPSARANAAQPLERPHEPRPAAPPPGFLGSQATVGAPQPTGAGHLPHQQLYGGHQVLPPWESQPWAPSAPGASAPWGFQLPGEEDFEAAEHAALLAGLQAGTGLGGGRDEPPPTLRGGLDGPGASLSEAKAATCPICRGPIHELRPLKLR